MKKIKSVKLKSFPNINLERKEGESGKIFWKSCLETVVLSEERLEDFKDSLEIEYEEERKYIDFRIECDPIYSFPSLDAVENFFKNECEIRNRLKVTKLAEGTL